MYMNLSKAERTIFFASVTRMATATVVILLGSYSPAIASNELLRSEAGEVLYLTHAEALTACPPGTHLPTAIEILKEPGQSNGARGVIEGRKATRDTNSKDYSAYSVVEADGSRSEFLFSQKVYSRNNPYEQEVWSSSRPIDDESWALSVTTWNGITFISKLNADTTFRAVRCFKN